MAKITKTKFVDKGRNKTYKVDVEFKAGNLDYSGGQKDKFFIRVNEVFKSSCKEGKWVNVCTETRMVSKEVWVVWGNTIEEVSQRWKDFMKEAVKVGIDEKKVILYKMEKVLPGKQRYGGNETKIEMTLDYRVLLKKTWGTQHTYLKQTINGQTEKAFANWVPTIGEDLKNHEWAEIDWTEETEQFFKDTYKAFTDMMEHVEKVISTKKSVIGLIDNKIKLLK